MILNLLECGHIYIYIYIYVCVCVCVFVCVRAAFVCNINHFVWSILHKVYDVQVCSLKRVGVVQEMLVVIRSINNVHELWSVACVSELTCIFNFLGVASYAERVSTFLRTSGCLQGEYKAEEEVTAGWLLGSMRFLKCLVILTYLLTSLFL